MRTLVGSLGLIAAVPLTTVIAAGFALYSHRLGKWKQVLGLEGCAGGHPHKILFLQIPLSNHETFFCRVQKVRSTACGGTKSNVNEEKTWILQAKNGSDEAFTYIVETYQTPVYNLCYRMLGHVEAAEDAAQETFLRAYQHLHRYDIKRSFATWLLSITAHYCIDR